MKVKLIIGDDSGDGHGHNRTLYYNINKSLEEIDLAYKQSCKLVGFDLDDCCSNYLENKISSVRLSKLYELGITYLKDVDNTYCFSWDEFTDLIFDFIKISLPDLEYEECDEDLPHLLNRDFGYGLFRD